jgi:hypothetical protein
MRILKYALFGLIVVGAAVGSYLYLPDHLAKLKAAKVTGTVTYDLEECSSEHPLFIEITNGSNDTVIYFEYKIEGRREGYSIPLYRSDAHDYSSDRIIANGNISGACWSLPRVNRGSSVENYDLHPPETLIWTVERIYPQFQNP